MRLACCGAPMLEPRKNPRMGVLEQIPTAFVALSLVTVGLAPFNLQVATVAEIFSVHVYAWFPDGAIRLLSPGRGFFVQASVHPQGTGAVFWGGSEGRPRLWLADFASKSARAVTPPNVGSVEPSFDWAGRRIVYASDAAGPTHLELLRIAQSWRSGKAGSVAYDVNLNLFVIDADGRNPQQITYGRFQDSRPAFDPEGKRIVFLSNRGGDRDGLYLAPIDGSSPPRRLLKEGGIGRPWFSPDGKFVYFFSLGFPTSAAGSVAFRRTGGHGNPSRQTAFRGVTALLPIRMEYTCGSIR